MVKKVLGQWPHYSADEINKVSEVLKSNKVNYWTGEQGKNFEEDFARYVGTKHAIALANGTLALELALKVLDLKEDDEVIVTPRSFIASVSCIVNAGAKPIFADVSPDSGNITEESIKKALTDKTKAIICVHLAGWPCDMDPILRLAQKRNLYVIEDCAQAHGTIYKGRAVGSIGHIGCWSFCQDKIMSTGGEGGMVVTDDGILWQRMWEYKDHGKNYDAVYKKEHAPGFRWLHESFGSNFRMTEIQSVLGKHQLELLDGWIERRNINAEFIRKVCDRFPSILRTPTPPPDVRHAYYKFYTYLKPDGLKPGWDRQKVIQEINCYGIPCLEGSCSEIYREVAFDKTSFRPKKRLKVAEELSETSIAFLVHPTLSKSDLEHTCEILTKVFTEVS